MLASSPASNNVAPGSPPASRAAAIERLQAFVAAGLEHYATSRNADLGPGNRQNVSTLSPYLRHRLILESEVLESALACFPLERVDKFVQEVFWRGYFKGWLEQHPSTWYAYRRDVLRLYDDLNHDHALRRRYEQAISGQTGIECFDVWCSELLAEGYLHNHARMWFASIWIFTLGLPWQLGADFFLRYLLDGDAASNTLGWRWVAGLHTRGKTYIARPDNIRKYTVGRFNPAPGSLAATAEPLTEAGRPEQIELFTGDRLPKTLRYGLLVTDDDCSPDSLELSRSPVGVIGLTSAVARSPLKVSEAVLRFSREAIADGIRHLSDHVECTDNVYEESDWGKRLSCWARGLELDAIVTAATPQGPANDLLGLAERHLLADGIPVLRLRRSYDLEVWPHATRGFFKLRKAIPRVLKNQRLVDT